MPFVVDPVESPVPASAADLVASAAWVGVVEVTGVRTTVTPLAPGEERAATFWDVRVIEQRPGDPHRSGTFAIFSDIDDRRVGDARPAWQPTRGQRFIVALAAATGPQGSAQWSSQASFLPLDPDLAREVAEARRDAADPSMAAFGRATLDLDPQVARRTLLAPR